MDRVIPIQKTLANAHEVYGDFVDVLGLRGLRPITLMSLDLAQRFHAFIDRINPNLVPTIVQFATHKEPLNYAVELCNSTLARQWPTMLDTSVEHIECWLAAMGWQRVPNHKRMWYKEDRPILVEVCNPAPACVRFLPEVHEGVPKPESSKGARTVCHNLGTLVLTVELKTLEDIVCG